MNDLKAAPLAGRRAVVTVASRGIGTAIVPRLGSAGAEVAIGARSLRSAVGDFRGYHPGNCRGDRRAGGKISVFALDMTSAESRQRLFVDATAVTGGRDTMPLDGRESLVTGAFSEQHHE